MVRRCFNKFCVILSLFLVLGFFGCSNPSGSDGKAESGNQAPNKENPDKETPEKEEIKEKTYSVDLTLGIKAGSYKEIDFSNNIKDGELKFTSSILPLPRTKAEISKIKLDGWNGEYFYYEYELPKEIKDQISSISPNLGGAVNYKLFVLSAEEIKDKKMDIKVAGGKVSYDWQKIKYAGNSVKVVTEEVVSLTNSKSENVNFSYVAAKPDEKIKDFVGTWTYSENDKLTYVMEFKNDKSGSYNFGADKTGEFTVDTSQVLGVKLVSKADNKTLGTAVVINGKLSVTPEKGAVLGDTTIVFEKKVDKK